MKFPSKWIPHIILAAIALGLIWYSPTGLPESMSQIEESYEGVVREILEETEGSQTISVEITKGDLAHKHEDVILESHDYWFGNEQRYNLKDKLVLMLSESPDEESKFYVVDHARRDAIGVLILLFLFVVVLVAKTQGLRAMLGMAFSFLVLFKWILPQILLGANPIITVILGAFLIIPGTFYLSHGLNKKTTVAVGGTLISLVITGILAFLFVKMAHLSGLASEEAAFLNLDTGETLHFQGLLMAGILISLLGILDDITISQSSIVNELIQAKKNIGFRELYNRALNVGRDHIASMVNTLVLVYTGASLPLFLLFIMDSQSWGEVLNYEFIAAEIVQTVVGSIGLVLAVPMTTLLAVAYEKAKLR